MNNLGDGGCKQQSGRSGAYVAQPPVLIHPDVDPAETLPNEKIQSAPVTDSIAIVKLQNLEEGQRSILRALTDLSRLIGEDTRPAMVPEKQGQGRRHATKDKPCYKEASYRRPEIVGEVSSEVRVTEERIEEEERIVRISLKPQLVTKKGPLATWSRSDQGPPSTRDFDKPAVALLRSEGLKLDKECQTLPDSCCCHQTLPDSSGLLSRSGSHLTPLTSETSTEEDFSQCSLKCCKERQKCPKERPQPSEALTLVVPAIPVGTTTCHSCLGLLDDESSQLLIESDATNIIPASMTDGHEDVQRMLRELKDKDMEIERLRGELKDISDKLKSTRQAPSTTTSALTVNGQIDLGMESPLNLFIQCFKQKYDISVNPNDVAIFV